MMGTGEGQCLTVNVERNHLVAMRRKLPRQKAFTASYVQSEAAAWRNRTQHNGMIVNVVVPRRLRHASPIMVLLRQPLV